MHCREEQPALSIFVGIIKPLFCITCYFLTIISPCVKQAYLCERIDYIVYYINTCQIPVRFLSTFDSFNPRRPSTNAPWHTHMPLSLRHKSHFLENSHTIQIQRPMWRQLAQVGLLSMAQRSPHHGLGSTDYYFPGRATSRDSVDLEQR